MPNGDTPFSLNNFVLKDNNNFMNEQDKNDMIRKLQEIIEVAVSIHFTAVKKEIKKNYDNHLDIMNNKINISLNSFIENINENANSISFRFDEFLDKANKRHKSSFNLLPMENKINKLNNDIEDLFNKNLNPIQNKIDLIRSNNSKRLSEIKSYFNNIVKLLGDINVQNKEILLRTKIISDRQFNFLQNIDKPGFFKRLMSKISRGNNEHE